MLSGCLTIVYQNSYSTLNYGEGKRKVGGKNKRYKDSVKVTLNELNINVENREALAADCPAWRSAVSSSARLAENKRIQESKTKRAIRKVQAASAVSTGIFLRTDLDFSVYKYLKSHGHFRIPKTNNNI